MKSNEIARHTHKDENGNVWEETYRLTRYEPDGTAVYTHEKTVLVMRAEKEPVT